MEQKHQKVENQSNGMEWKLKSVLPMGEDEGFFFIEHQPVDKFRKPLRVKTVTLELMNGSTYRLEIKREKRNLAGSLTWQLARVLKGLVDSESTLIRTDEAGKFFQRYITYKDLGDAFNQEMEIGTDVGMKPGTVGLLCREELELPVGRRNEGFVVYLENY